MSYQFTMEIQGDEILQKALEDKTFLAEPITKMLEDACSILEPRVIEKTPIDLGELKGSIDSKVYPGDPMPEGAVIGTNLPRAPFSEWDTRPHWPPWGPGSLLAGWAGRHGIKPFLVARAISIRGTVGKHMFGDTLKESGSDLNQLAQETGAEIERKWRESA